jgi:nucleotide-binding universal stress UspA family protein
MMRAMTILCATDLSENARQAARAAAVLAKGRGSRLMLLHVVDHIGAEQTFADENLVGPIRRVVEALASELRAEFGVEVEATVTPGFADETVADIADHHQVELVVVGSLGRRKEGRWLLGSVAERIAQGCTRPVLIIRDAERILAARKRPLRVLAAIETPSTMTLPTQHATSAAALRAAASLRASMATTVTIATIVWPQREHARLGIKTGMPLDGLNPEVEGPLRRDLEAFARALPGVVDAETRFVLKPGWGRTDSHVVQLAIDEDHDVVVVGTHRRAGLARVWSGSVSRGVLHDAPTNVLCVPSAASRGELAPAARPKTVVVPVDFSASADRAVPFAYGLVGDAGRVHLLHVHVPGGDQSPDAEAELRARVIPGAASTSVEVVVGEDVAAAVCAAAARLGADAICIATHGRSGVSRALMGSQAEQVVRRAGRPVVLVPPADA